MSETNLETVAPATEPMPAEKTTMDIVEIMSILPHRYPFLLIDRVVEMERKVRIVAIKNVSMNEPFFVGHFPDYPIMPGVLQIEAMAQAGGALLLTEIPDRADKLMVFTGIEEARFRRPVTPGDQLRIEVTVVNWRSRAVKMAGVITVNGKVVSDATITCQLVPRVREPKPATEAPATEAPTAWSTLSAATIHPTAIVAEGAIIAAGCKIGPYCTVGANVVLGEECELVSHVVLDGHTTLGRKNRIFSFSCIGIAPQDLKYKNEPTRLEIGDENDIREYVTISRGTVGGGGMTRVGSNCLIMAYTHIGHDSTIGNGCILPNGATLAGHVTVEDYATLSANAPVHQFCTIGRYAYIGGGTTITQDVMPYSLTSIERNNHAYGLNKVGLQRRGFTAEELRELTTAMRLLTSGKRNTTQALEEINDMIESGAGGEHVKYLAEFVKKSERGVIK